MIGQPVELIQVPNQRGWPPKKAAMYLGVHVHTLKKMTDLGLIEAKWDPHLNRRSYLLEELDRYLDGLPEYNPCCGENPAGTERSV